jgi:tetratricopeptide (TPR) repeat protein
MDFGLARTTVAGESAASGSSTQQAVGTPEYMAPEQLSGREVTPATDVYALGLILFEMLTGQPPFRSTSTLESIMRRARESPRRLHGVVDGVTPQFDAVIARALAFEPKDRYASVADVTAALDRSDRRGTVTLPSRRGALAAGATALVAAGAALSIWLWPRAAAPSPTALRWLDDAQQSLAEGATVRARNDALRAVEEAPAFAPVHATLAEILLELEMPGRANEAMLQAGVAAPDRSALSAEQREYVSGVQSLLVRDCDSALRHFAARSSETSPDRPLRLMTTARAYERCDKTDDADRTLRAAAELDTRNPAVPLRRGRLLGRRGDIDGAMAAFALAESLFRDRNNLEGVAEVFASRGAVEADDNRLEEAEATLDRAAEYARALNDVRQSIRVALWQAVVRRKQDRLEDARTLTTQAIELARRHDLEAVAVDGLFATGNVYLTRNQFDEARTLYERALAIAETNRHEAQRARGRLSLASLYVRMMEPDRALAEIAEARPYYQRIRHLRNLGNADMLEGQARMMRGDYAACIALYTNAIALARERKDAPAEALAQENLATALSGAGRMREALAAYRAAAVIREARKQPRPLFYARLNIADSLSKLGAFEEAESAFPPLPASTDPAPELESQRSFILASHLLRRGRHAQAFTAAERSMTLAASMLERRTHASAVACVAAASRGDHATAAARCAQATSAAATTTGTALKLEVALASAEAAHARGDRVGAEAQLEDAAGLMRPEPHEHRWRLLALRAAVDGMNGRPARTGGDALSRELERLRLEWGERDYALWHQRPDVRRVLTAAGAH